jgi:hypothetical protein
MGGDDIVNIFSVEFVKAAGERALKTFSQALVALFAAGITILNIDWTQALAVAGTAALLSILTSIASNNVGSYYGPSLSDEAVMVDPDDE